MAAVGGDVVAGVAVLGGGDASRFQAVSEAYRILSKEREAYDALYRSRSRSTTDSSSSSWLAGRRWRFCNMGVSFDRGGLWGSYMSMQQQQQQKQQQRQQQQQQCDWYGNTEDDR